MAAGRRNYIDSDSVNSIVSITPTAVDLDLAEELIDQYVGFQAKFIQETFDGRVASVGSNVTFTLQTNQQNAYESDYLLGLIVEIIGGTGIGSVRRITGSTKAGVVTVDSAVSLATTSVYRIYQLGKFPRTEDVFYDGTNSPYQYYKQIPDLIKRAVAVQIEFMNQMGSTFFKSDNINYDSESIGNYSYSKGMSAGQLNNLIAPKAKIYLRGIVNRKGTMILD